MNNLRNDDTLRKLVTLKQGTLIKIRDLLNTGNEEQLRSTLNFYRDIMNKIGYLENATYRNENFPEVSVSLMNTPQDAYSDYAKFIGTSSLRNEAQIFEETPLEEEAKFLSRPLNTANNPGGFEESMIKVPYQERVRPPLKYTIPVLENQVPERYAQGTSVLEPEPQRILPVRTDQGFMHQQELDNRRQSFLINPSIESVHSLASTNTKDAANLNEGMIFRSDALQQQYDYKSQVTGETDLLVSPEEELFANYSI